MDADQLALLSASLDEMFADAVGDVSRVLAELGWEDVVAEDQAVATRLLFAAHARARARTTILDRFVLDALRDDVPALASSVLWPSGTADGEIHGVLTHLPADDDIVVAPVAGATATSLAVVRGADLVTVPLHTFDPALHWFEATVATPAGLVATTRWDSAVAAACRALATELITLSHEVLRLSVEHTSTRTQFGAPIAAFQAVRHRLADGRVAITAAEGLLDVAFDDGGLLAARLAKAQAGRAHQLVSGHAVQVCGAIGATLEHPLHTFIDRGVVLDSLLGRWDDIVGELGDLVLATTTAMPRLVEV
ncbi:MAG TPA: acyl-CoA dehydrogenase family protein [Mycobacteriales bacterium]|jgi:hypothetical protein|nr:acyl-CoA dehydrogenase family protein [Mycobacteriales bacterium]HVV75832.1 acyl-CoA dehydrogenase family protein [Mycobacteriales bacterium]HVY10830.1 acyl-CoA dehydrogenase family protein [Mycobacteriales bacterium]